MKKFGKWIFKYKYLIFALAILVSFGGEVISLGNEVGMRVVITSLGIDKEGSEYSVSAQVFTPQLDETKTQAKSVVTVTAPTIAEAINRMSLKTGRIATVSHCRLIVVGDSVLEENLKIPLNYFMKDHDIGWGAILVATGGKAEETLDGLNGLEEKASFSWQKFLNSNREYDTVTVTSLREAFINLTEEGKTFLLNVLDVEKPEEDGGGAGGGGGGGAQAAAAQSGGENDTTEKGSLVMGERTLVIRDGIRVGELGPDEVRGYSWLDTKVDKAIFEVDDVDNEEYRDAKVSVQMKKRNVYTSCLEENGKPVFEIRVKAVYDNVEVLKAEHQHILTSEEVAEQARAIEEAVNREVEKQIRACYDKSVECGADVLAIGRRFFKYKTALYDRYGEDLFREIELRCKIESKLSM